MWDRFIQAFSIMVSILLAFAIDAWWEDSQERERYLAQLNTLKVEFQAAREELDWQRQRLLSNRAAIAQILEWAGHDPAPVSFERLTEQIDLTFRGAAINLQTGALRALVSSGVIGHMQQQELLGLLAEWPTYMVDAQSQTTLLLHNREEIIRYLHPRIPTIEVAYHTGQMGAYPRTSFVGDAETLLSDMEFEGLMGNRGMLVEDSLLYVAELEKRLERALTLIEREFADSGLN